MSKLLCSIAALTMGFACFANDAQETSQEVASTEVVSSSEAPCCQAEEKESCSQDSNSSESCTESLLGLADPEDSDDGDDDDDDFRC